MAQAMGIHADQPLKASQQPTTRSSSPLSLPFPLPPLPWANQTIQTQFLCWSKHIDWMTWMCYYDQYCALLNITTVSDPPTDPTDPPIRSSGATYTPLSATAYHSIVPVYRKSHHSIYCFLFLIIAGLYCLATVPYYGANSAPVSNLPSLHILVINAEGEEGLVGRQLVAYLQKFIQTQSADTLPAFQYLTTSSSTSSTSSSSSSLEHYRNVMLHSADGTDSLESVWAVLYVSPNATFRLFSALANHCDSALASQYDPTTAITFLWDEARNPTVAVPYIALYLRSLLHSFETTFATSLMTLLPSNTITGCVQQGHATLLVTPIAHIEQNITPVGSTSPVGVAAITVGNIVVAIFGGTIVGTYVNLWLPGYLEGVIIHPVHKLIVKTLTMALIGFGLAVVNASLVIGLSTISYSADIWASLFALQWIHSMFW